MCSVYTYFFFNDTATTEIYTLSLHDALPIWLERRGRTGRTRRTRGEGHRETASHATLQKERRPGCRRSEEHTSELQSRQYLVCRLLLEKKNNLTLTSSTYSYSLL